MVLWKERAIILKLSSTKTNFIFSRCLKSKSKMKMLNVDICRVVKNHFIKIKIFSGCQQTLNNVEKKHVTFGFSECPEAKNPMFFFFFFLSRKKQVQSGPGVFIGNRGSGKGVHVDQVLWSNATQTQQRVASCSFFQRFWLWRYAVIQIQSNLLYRYIQCVCMCMLKK